MNHPLSLLRASHAHLSAALQSTEGQLRVQLSNAQVFDVLAFVELLQRRSIEVISLRYVESLLSPPAVTDAPPPAGESPTGTASPPQDPDDVG